MEKKKLLLVAVSVGMFLVIVVSAAILVFSPPSAAFSSSSPAGSGSPNWAAGPAVSESSINNPSSPAPVAEISQGAGISLNDGSGLIVDAKGEGPTTIKLEPLLTAGVPDTAKPAPAPAPVKPAAQAKPAATPAPAAKPAAPSAEPRRERRDFWVQVGSYSTRERADGAKLTLGDRGLSAIITNQLVNGETRYRVRVGPYDSKNEADYWLAMIKNIDSFKDSLVWESQSYR
ncbi:MAG: SPOR domain-containing protein [Spirochaetaceae bacterium]|jgi:DedD protein|nr:SPOR domain-containing protein [Spirochaetaceae bacterium]